MIGKIIKNNLVVIIFFAAFFLYLWLQINPALYYQQQEPVFLLDYNFFSSFTSSPGGLTEYLSAFLSQFFLFPFIGSFIITSIVLVICKFSKTILKAIYKNYEISFLHLIPAILLLSLYSNYWFSLSYSLGLLISLMFVNLYILLKRSNPLIKLSLYLLLGIILYYITAGPSVLYLFLGICIEILSDVSIYKKALFVLLNIAFAVAVPYIASNLSQVINLSDAYFGTLPFNSKISFSLTPYILYLYLPLIIIMFEIRKRYFVSEKKEVKKKKKLSFKEKLQKVFSGRTKYIAQTSVLFILAGLAAFLSFNEKYKISLLIDYYAQNEKWEDVVKIANTHKFISQKSVYQTNRALFHLGQLSSNMFSYPQVYGTEGVVPSGDFMTANTSLMSDVFFELGFLNPSQHWASDALTHSGETKHNLNRLFLINLLSGNKHFAQNCLNILKETMFSKSLTDDYQRYLNDSNYLNSNDKLSRILSCNIDSNFVFQSDNMIVEFKSLLKKNLNNKMAFEYLMAYYLLNCNLGSFVNYLVFLRNFGYTELPRHYEEALLIFMGMTGIRKNITPGFSLNPSISQRFSEFRNVLANYKGDLSLAKNELMEKFGDTYWYYMVYSPAFRKTLKKRS